MSRTQRGPIDYLAGYTVIDPFVDPITNLPDPPHEDYYEVGGITIWGIGLITFGPPTAAQQAWLAEPANFADLSTFPTDWISFGFPMDPGPLEIWGSRWVAGVVITEQGIKGADAWSFDGQTGTGVYFFSDLSLIDGTGAGETIDGTAAAETINGLAGDDILLGGDGSDALYGGVGNDQLFGGGGPDRLWGGNGDDLLAPGSDSAFIYVTPAPERAGVYFVDGGAGFDTLLLDYSASDKSQYIVADQILASEHVRNVEAVAITGSQQSDVLIGSANADHLYGGGGFDLLKGGAGDDVLDAGPADVASVAAIGEGGRAEADAMSLDYLFTETSGLPSASFYIRQTENSVAGWGVQPAAGNIFSFTVGEAGAQAFIDYLVNADGGTADFGFRVTDENGGEVPTSYSPTTPIVFPHAGTYYLHVGITNSNQWSFGEIWVTLTLEGGLTLGSNVLEGGAGNDTYLINSATDQVIELAGAGSDTVITSVSYALGANVENLTLSGSAVVGSGNALHNLVIGNSSANAIDGQGGNDALLGGAGTDQLSGGTGNDVLGGGAGGDMLAGGAGTDVFIFTRDELGTTKTGPHDLVSDFASGDKIDLSALYQGLNFGGIKAGNAAQAASLSGFKAIHYVENGRTFVIGDTNGAAGADFTIELLGVHKLTSSDLIVGKSAMRDWDRLANGYDYQLLHQDSSPSASLTGGSLGSNRILGPSDAGDQFRMLHLADSATLI